MSHNFSAFVEYLKAPSLIMLSNSQRFDSSIFSELSVVKESVWSQNLFNPTVPNVV